MDLTASPSPDPEDLNDPLSERLRDEARAHRPPFSPKLHDRIMNRIHGRERDDRAHHAIRIRRVIRFAAAIAIVAVLLAVSWNVRWHHASTPTSPNVIVKSVLATIPVKPTPEAFKFQIAGVISAHLLPPRIEFQLPSLNPSSPNDSESSVSATSTGLPERILSELWNPTVRASESLNDVVPPNFRLLLPLIQPAIHRGNSKSLD